MTARFFRHVGRVFTPPLVRAFWLGLVPLAFGLAAIRFLVVDPIARVPVLFARIHELMSTHLLLTYVGAVLLFAALLSYWRAYLPGRRFLTGLPRSKQRVPSPEWLQRSSRALRTLQRVTRLAARRRLRQQLDGAGRRQLKRALRAAFAGLRTNNLSQLCEAAGRIDTLTQGILKPTLVRGLTFAGTLAIALVAAWLLKTQAAAFYEVESTSMLPTLLPSDRLFATKGAFRGVRPKRGDIVVYRAPEGEVHAKPEIVKRVIGLPGDTIRMRRGFFVINDWQVPHCNAGQFTYLTSQGFTSGIVHVEWLADSVYLSVHSYKSQKFRGSYTIGPDEVFVAGDNRHHSHDSRSYHHGNGGGVPFENLLAKIERVVFSRQRSGANNWQRLLAPLELQLSSEGVDLEPLRAGVQRCLAEPPQQTYPPASRPKSKDSS